MARNRQAAVRPKQSLGQNFLVDDNIVRNIVRDMNIQPDDVVLEIGPGTGALTGHLAGLVRHLIIVEIDGRVIDGLRSRFTSFPVTILHEDILNTDFGSLASKMNCRLRIAGNLPYHLTSPILFRLFECSKSVRDATFMVQKEVAQRITAGPGSKEYGVLSVMTRFHGTAKTCFDVSPSCFYPKPRVVSTVIQIAFPDTGKPAVDADPQLFSTVVRTTFGKRRKTLRNSLHYLPFEEPVVDRIIGSLRFPLERRPETLSLEEFAELTRQVSGGLKAQ
jgi:16S rRNA (adenine1518-N6/adenine1519-N6)-dimethyltransferase